MAVSSLSAIRRATGEENDETPVEEPDENGNGEEAILTQERYAHLADDPLREAATKIGGVIAGAGKSDNVVTLSRRGGA